MTKKELIAAITLESELYLGFCIAGVSGLNSLSKDQLVDKLEHHRIMNSYYSNAMDHPEGTLLNVLYRRIAAIMWLGASEDKAIIESKEYCRSMIEK